jgi:hypothetical protein
LLKITRGIISWTNIFQLKINLNQIIMKTITIKLLSATVLSIFILGTGCKSQQSVIDKVNKKEINDVFHEVYLATQQAVAKVKGDEFKIDNIDLTFKTVSTIEVSGGIKLWVVTGKFTRSNSSAQSTTYSFGESPDKIRTDEDPNTKKFRQYLESAIRSSKNIQPVGAFGLQSFQVDVEFTITNTSEAGVEVEILPITPSIGGSHAKEFTHSISIKFSKKS